MAYDELLADRIRQAFKEKKTSFTEKKMFSGLCFMVDEKMCCGIHFDKKKNTDLLMARIGEEASVDAMLERASTEEHYVEDQFRVLKADPKETMKLLFAVALADKQLEENEVAVLRRLAERLDVLEADFNKLLAEAQAISGS